MHTTDFEWFASLDHMSEAFLLDMKINAATNVYK